LNGEEVSFGVMRVVKFCAERLQRGFVQTRRDDGEAIPLHLRLKILAH
jgi:hypothetical protein